MRVYNIRGRSEPIPEDAVYVGRGWDPRRNGRTSEWGNPAAMLKESQRDEVCASFEIYARERLRTEPHWLDPLIGKDLICHCYPKRCHADTLLKMAAEVASLTAEDRAALTAEERDALTAALLRLSIPDILPPLERNRN